MGIGNISQERLETLAKAPYEFSEEDIKNSEALPALVEKALHFIKQNCAAQCSGKTPRGSCGNRLVFDRTFFPSYYRQVRPEDALAVDQEREAAMEAAVSRVPNTLLDDVCKALYKVSRLPV